MKKHQYWIYIITNPQRTKLYIGVTNNLTRRLKEHFLNKGTYNSYAGKHYCYKLIYYEEFKYITEAIKREKQLKRWRREKKEFLINTINPYWNFLNYKFMDEIVK